jgi:hypothetical protein
VFKVILAVTRVSLSFGKELPETIVSSDLEVATLSIIEILDDVCIVTGTLTIIKSSLDVFKKSLVKSIFNPSMKSVLRITAFET